MTSTFGLLIVTALVGVVGIAAAIMQRPVGRHYHVCPDGNPIGHIPDDRRPPVFGAIGHWIRGVLRQPEHAASDQAAGRAFVMIVVVGLVHVGFAAVVAFVLWIHSVVRRRRHARGAQEKVSAGLADVIDLFAVALLSGNTVAEATTQVCDWAEGDFADGFAWCNRRVGTGVTLADALESLPARLGPQTRPLVAALVSTERYGAPIADNVAQLAADTRSDRRRHAEAAARRLPIELLFPLVVCVLPAFLLVTVVPVIAETMANLNVVASP